MFALIAIFAGAVHVGHHGHAAALDYALVTGVGLIIWACAKLFSKIN
jgi:hypothetical protein